MENGREHPYIAMLSKFSIAIGVDNGETLSEIVKR